MNTKLDRGSKKHICPSCGKKRFVRYTDLNGNYLPDEFGRCDRELECGYFLKPLTERTQFNQVKQSESKRVFIPAETMKATRSHYEDNSFVQYLATLFDLETVKRLIQKYNLGTTKHFNGGCIFWFIDTTGNVCYGQVKKFNPDGHTAKDTEGDQMITGVHYLLSDSWVNEYRKQETKISCLFGEHLLKSEPFKQVALVEAPKTAIIASVYFPEYLWLAVGSLSYLTEQRTKSLKGRKVILFPDLGCYHKWKVKGDLFGFETSDTLERLKSENETGLDLADYLTRFNVLEFIKCSCSPNTRGFNEHEHEHSPSEQYFETLKDGRTILMHPAGYPASWEIHKPELVNEMI